ncbi:probable serine/threonine protein kinase IRE, partial [Tanacetum coccineum]
MESSATREYPSLIHTFFLTDIVGGVFLNPEDKALYDEMLRLQGLGSNTPSGVPYTDDEIMAITHGGKQRGHIPGVGRVLLGQGTVIPPPPPCTHTYDVVKLKKSKKRLTRQPEYGGGSESGGCGDDEPGDDENGGRKRMGRIRTIVRRCWEIGKSSRIDDKVVQDQRQRDDYDLQDERQYQPKEEEVEPRRRKMARTGKSMVLAIAALRNLEVHQMDVKMTFPNGELGKVLYMNQPEGFMAPGLESKVCRLVKSLYGLRKAPKQRHQISPYHASAHDHNGHDYEDLTRSGCTTALNVVPWETDGESVLRKANSFEALNVDSPITEEVDSGNKAFISGVQEEGQSSTPLLEKIYMFEAGREHVCLWMMRLAGKMERNYDPYDDDMYESQEISDNLQSICDNFDINIRCTCCGEESTKEVCLSLDEREFHTRQEPEVHLVKKCQGCKLTGTITMTPGQGFPLSNSLSRRGRAAALMRFRCVGYEPYGFISNGLWRAERMDGTPITHIDIKMGPLTYPEDDGEPSASISDVVFEFRQAR